AAPLPGAHSRDRCDREWALHAHPTWQRAVSPGTTIPAWRGRHLARRGRRPRPRGRDGRGAAGAGGGGCMGEAMGRSLPLAIGVALSPIPIIAVVILLTSSRARSLGPVFVLGWLLGLVVVGTIVLALIGPSGAASSGQRRTWVSWVMIVLGVLLLVAAVRHLRGRARA